MILVSTIGVTTSKTAFEQDHPMVDGNKKILFIYSGEGTRGADTDTRLFRQSRKWSQIEDILKTEFDLDMEQLWQATDSPHACPNSPLITVIAQICLSDIWTTFGYTPQVVIGHSTGELCAAYQAGLYSLEEILHLAHGIGKVAARLDGAMVHGWLSESELEACEQNISSFNFKREENTHVTLSGTPGDIDRFLEKNNAFVRMKLPHPWHLPDYARFQGELAPVPSNTIDEGLFVSGITSRFETCLPENHWRQWLVSPVNFILAVQAVQDRYPDDDFQIIEIGFHPVLANAFRIFSDATIVSSICRDEDVFKWLFFQRSQLDQGVMLEKIRAVADGVKPGLDFDTSLAYQGMTSLDITKLAGRLHPLFPSLAPQDFFRFKTIHQLVSGFGIEKKQAARSPGQIKKNKVVVSGMSCRFPSSVETPAQFWQMLTSGEDQVGPDTGRSSLEAGFLDRSVTGFDHAYFNISRAEARTMDPQQILALELTEMLWKDAGMDPDLLDKKRVGVYIGVWNQEYQGDKHSVFYPTGVNPSIISARISYHYDLRGPSMVFNTACSSSLMAVHYAAKDIEAGRVDYAVAGGVNLLLDESFSLSMQSSGFLSKDHRCKAFDDSANGYVRAEGGGLVLMVNKDLASEFYASLEGSAVNQNGGRSQVITAPHPEAQEELIMDACHEAQISPGRIDYVETHGTGTKIGDPIEISAIQNTVAKNRSTPCRIGSVKSNLGHLESAAGMAGLIKSLMALQKGKIPPNLHFTHPNRFIDFDTGQIQVVTEQTDIDHQAYIGISSFGFGGSNAHVIIKGARETDRKRIQDIVSPFNRENSIQLSQYKSSSDNTGPGGENFAPSESSTADIPGVIRSLLFEVTGNGDMDPDVELLDQGLDSLSGTELISRIMDRFTIEVEPEILFEYPLPDLFIQRICELIEDKGH